MLHTNPFAPNPANPYSGRATGELEPLAEYLTKHTTSAGSLYDLREEQSRREDVDTAVELWERLCAVPFVRGETQGYYTHSTCHLTPDTTDYAGTVKRMPDTAELEALVLSDGEETAYPPHDVPTRPGSHETRDENPWSYGDRLYPVTLTLISCGDYHGSDVDAANNRALRGTPGVDVREPNTGGQGSVFNVSTTVVGEMSSFENATSAGDWERDPAARRSDALAWLSSLVTDMEGLVEYALLDDEEHSKLVDELAEQAWEAALQHDVRAEVTELAGCEEFPYAVPGLGLFDDADDLVDALFDASGNRLPGGDHYPGLDGDDAFRAAYYDFEDNDWAVDSLAHGATNGRHTEAVRHATWRTFHFGGPCPCTVCAEELCDVDDCDEFLDGDSYDGLCAAHADERYGDKSDA